jgi:hypothetical protein
VWKIPANSRILNKELLISNEGRSCCFGIECGGNDSSITPAGFTTPKCCDMMPESNKPLTHAVELERPYPRRLFRARLPQYYKLKT